MYFTNVELKNFRNYKEENVKFHPKVNIIWGNNGQGKTNLLESLYIMSLGKSFRTNKDTDMIGFCQEFCSAKSTFIKDEIDRNIEVIISNEGKSIIIDGNKIKKSKDLLENAYIVAFTPEDMKIVKDEPEKRRKFLDRELCMIRPVYYSNLAKYKKILQQRNSLLKSDIYNENHLEVWDFNLASYGSKIIKQRINYIEKLKVVSNNLHSEITNGKERLELFYESSITSSGSNEEIESKFLEKLYKGRKADRYRGTTGFGPHRDDIKININGIDVRSFGSQGQQRTAALSLKLAEIEIIKEEKGYWPVLLLDDVLSELDEKRQEFLLKTLNSVQLFITTAEMKESLIGSIKEKKVFTVTEGKCE